MIWIIDGSYSWLIHFLFILRKDIMNLDYNKKKVCGSRDHSIVIMSWFYKGLGGMNFI